MSRARIISALTSIAVLAGAAGVAVVATAGSSDTYTVTADVEQAPNLFAGGRVVVRGVEVGEIADVEPTKDAVRLTLEIGSDVRIPADATLSIIPITVISDRYVQFFPAYEGGPVLEDGDHLPLDRTAIPAELEDVLTQLRGLLAALEPKPNKEGPLARLIAGLDAAFAGKADALGGAVENSASALEDLAGSDVQLRGLIANLDRVFVALADRSSEIGLVNERLELVVEALLSDQGALEGTIENVAFLSEQGAAIVNESGDRLGASFGRLGRVLRTVLRYQDQLRLGIQWTNVIAQALGATDSSGRGLYAYSGRQAPPGTERAGYNYRIDSRDTIACERIGALVESFKVLNPNATPEQLRNTLLGFVPPTYIDDITFILDLLLPFCADLSGPSSLDAEAKAVVVDVAERVGRERFGRMLARWLIEGYAGEVSP